MTRCLAIAAGLFLSAVAAAAQEQPGTILQDCPVCPELVVVPAGLFIMGSPPSERGRQPDEGPQRRVVIPQPFALGRFEVTHAQWEACLADGGCRGYRPSDHGWGRGDRPVMNVNWADIQSYLTWLNQRTGRSYRLPSEAEWEYAARAGAASAFPWGDHARADPPLANCYKCGSPWGGKGTAPVGQFPPNRFGLFDMAGNVWEWTADCHHPNYDGAPADTRPWREASGGDCARRVQRGGSWYYIGVNSRAARRSFNRVEARWYDVGFRVARYLD